MIPTYRRPGLLRRLLESIHAQSYRQFEVIVVDDCSPEEGGYADIVQQLSQRFREFSYLRNDSNRGAPHSRNRGICQSKYELVALVDDDDEWLPQKLQRQVEVFAGSPAEVGLVYTWTDVVESGKSFPVYRAEIEGQCFRQILKECFIPSPSVMVRKDALRSAGLFDETLPSCQDWDMWTRIFKQGYEARVVKEVLTLYHKHPSDSIGTSPQARKGYAMYYRKHILSLVRYGEWRHLVRMVRWTAGL
jgi:glycosyltransferase involved in cell wall biosynthesis